MNGDLFNLQSAFPSGIFMSGGVLAAAPEPSRSALGFDPTGALYVARMVLSGRYQAIDPVTGRGLTVRSFGGVDRPALRSSEVILYTPQYGPATPVAGSRYEALIALDGGAMPQVNAPAPTGGTVLATRAGGGMPIGPGQVVLTAVGASGPSLAQDLTVGRRVSLSVGVAGPRPGHAERDRRRPRPGGRRACPPGRRRASARRSSAAAPRAPPSGRPRAARCCWSRPRARTRAAAASPPPSWPSSWSSLGAVTAIGMDAGGSAQQTLYDDLVIPWASERPITDALVVNYAGMQVLPLTAPRLSPNQDGVDDRELVTVRSALPGPGDGAPSTGAPARWPPRSTRARSARAASGSPSTPGAWACPTGPT